MGAIFAWVLAAVIEYFRASFFCIGGRRIMPCFCMAPTDLVNGVGIFARNGRMRRRTSARFSLDFLSCFRAASATSIYFLYFVICDGVRHLGERLVGEAGVGQPVWLPLSLGGGNGLMILAGGALDGALDALFALVAFLLLGAAPGYRAIGQIRTVSFVSTRACVSQRIFFMCKTGHLAGTRSFLGIFAHMLTLEQVTILVLPLVRNFACDKRVVRLGAYLKRGVLFGFDYEHPFAWRFTLRVLSLCPLAALEQCMVLALPALE